MKQMKRILILAVVLFSLLSPLPVLAAGASQLSAPTTGSLATPHIQKAEARSDGVRLTWSRVNQAAKYRVFRRSGDRWVKLGDTSGLTFTDETAKAGHRYRYTLRCLDSKGRYASKYDKAGFSAAFLATPRIGKLECVSSGVGISWEQVKGADTYRVFRRDSKNKWTQLGDTSRLFFTDQTAAPGKSYTYTVRCVSADGRTYESFYSAKGASILYLSAPVLRKAELSGKGIQLQWRRVAGAEAYRVFYRIDSGKWCRIQDTSDCTCTFYDLKPDVTYDFTVRCLSKDGKQYHSYCNQGLSFFLSKEECEKAFKHKIICIDPGHQKKANTGKEAIGPGSSQTKYKVTGGATGNYTGQREYELNLKVSLKLQKELERRGYQVVMVRTTNNVNITNQERTAIANKARADAFIRIHADSDSRSSARGAMTICPASTRFVSKDIKNQSKTLSQCVLDGLCAASGAKKRPIWETDTMTGINWSKVPVTIVEMGFLSNPTEDRLMATDAYQNKLVKGMADGLDQYFQNQR